MELHPLIPPDLPQQVDRGWSRAVSRGPVTVDQALARGLQQMLDEDRAEREAADPVVWARAHRPRRRLIDALFRRRQ